MCGWLNLVTTNFNKALTIQSFDWLNLIKYVFFRLLLFVLLSILEVKWERGVKGHNIPKFSELTEDKLR